MTSHSRALRIWCVVLFVLACTTVATAFWRYGRQDERAAPRPVSTAKLELPHVVRSVRQVENYTYLELMDAPDSTYWIASPQVAAEVGDQVVYSGVHPMKQFHSRALGVTFDQILFVDLVHAIGPEGTIRAGSDHSRAAPLRPEAEPLADGAAPEFDPRDGPAPEAAP